MFHVLGRSSVFMGKWVINLSASSAILELSSYEQNCFRHPGGVLDQDLPIGAAIFHILGVFLARRTCIVRSKKRCFHKLTAENWLWRGNLTPLVVIRRDFC